MSRERDLIRAMDKRAEDRITDYEAQHTIEVGVVKGLTLAGASVQMSESGRFLRNVPRTQGIELVVGATVLLARVTRRKWVIIGALEADNALTPTTANYVPVAGIQDLVCEDRPGYMEVRWTASYFQIECYEVQVNTVASEEGATTYVTDNTQFIYVDDVGTYYARVRAVGPNWQRGSWSSWTEGDVLVLSTTFVDLTDTPGTYSGYSDNILIVNALEDALEYIAFQLTSLKDTPDSLSGQAGQALIVNDTEDGFGFGESGAVAFLDLGDTPSDYTDKGGWVVGVASDETALEFRRYYLMLVWDQITDVAVGNASTEESLFGSGRGTKTLVAGNFIEGTHLRIHGGGHLSTTGTPALTMKIYLGSTEMCSSGAVALNSSISDVGFRFEIDIICRTEGETGTMVASGVFEYDEDSQHTLVKTSEVTVNTTVDQEVNVTVQWGTADPLNTITCQMLLIELIDVDTLSPANPSNLGAE